MNPSPSTAPHNQERTPNSQCLPEEWRFQTEHLSPKLLWFPLEPGRPPNIKLWKPTGLCSQVPGYYSKDVVLEGSMITYCSDSLRTQYRGNRGKQSSPSLSHVKWNVFCFSLYQTEDEMVGWHHWLNGHEFEETLGDTEEQRSLLCCSPWGCKELTQLRDWTKTTTRKQVFSKFKFLSPGETMTAIWEPSATSSQIGAEELRGGERQPSATLAISQ